MFLLDSNYCIKCINGDKVLEKLFTEENVFYDLVTCVVVEGELIYGALKSKFPDKNLNIVKNFLSELSVISMDRETATIYGKIKSKLIKKYSGKKRTKTKRVMNEIGVSDNDLWIACIAIKNNLTVLTEDSDFEKIASVSNLKYENWLK